jgi:hypothetical protein
MPPNNSQESGGVTGMNIMFLRITRENYMVCHYGERKTKESAVLPDVKQMRQ